MTKHILTVAFVTIACAGTALGAEEIRYEALLAHLGNDLEHRGFKVVTLDGKEHSGRRLHLESDHVRVFHRRNRWDDLPSEQISRIEISQGGRFFHHIIFSAALPVWIGAFACDTTGGSGTSRSCMVYVTAVFSPVWAYTAATAPVYLAAVGVAFLIPPKVYEIVH